MRVGGEREKIGQILFFGVFLHQTRVILRKWGRWKRDECFLFSGLSGYRRGTIRKWRLIGVLTFIQVSGISTGVVRKE